MIVRFRDQLRALLRDARGSSEINVHLLLGAAGCSMVVMTAPYLFNSSKVASNAFQRDVQVLERGSSGGGGGASGMLQDYGGAGGGGVSSPWPGGLLGGSSGGVSGGASGGGSVSTSPSERVA